MSSKQVKYNRPYIGMKFRSIEDKPPWCTVYKITRNEVFYKWGNNQNDKTSIRLSWMVETLEIGEWYEVFDLNDYYEEALKL